jgi:crotonobetainyl-CoA:carnitine CoA-transferase CaiB-like acyl-CoA transferase
MKEHVCLLGRKKVSVSMSCPQGKGCFSSWWRAVAYHGQFPTGTMLRLGLDHESLTQVKPDIITLSCTAYGHTGPWRAYGARARTVDAVCGLSSLTGYEGGPALRASSNYMDHSGGLNVAFALLLALYQRRKTGAGMRLDLSMYETGVSCITPALLETQRGIIRPRLAPPTCSRRHNVYPARALTAGSPSRWPDDQWRALYRDGRADWAGDALHCQGRWQLCRPRSTWGVDDLTPRR